MIELSADAREQLMENLLVVIPEFRWKLVLPAPVRPGCLDFVIANPDNYAGMISQPQDVIGGFLSDILEKLIVGGIHTPCEHEILPNQDPHLVTQIIEVISFIDPATPNTQHIHIRILSRFD